MEIKCPIAILGLDAALDVSDVVSSHRSVTACAVRFFLLLSVHFGACYFYISDRMS